MSKWYLGFALVLTGCAKQVAPPKVTVAPPKPVAPQPYQPPVTPMPPDAIKNPNDQTGGDGTGGIPPEDDARQLQAIKDSERTQKIMGVSSLNGTFTFDPCAFQSFMGTAIVNSDMDWCEKSDVALADLYISLDHRIQYLSESGDRSDTARNLQMAEDMVGNIQDAVSARRVILNGGNNYKGYPADVKVHNTFLETDKSCGYFEGVYSFPDALG